MNKHDAILIIIAIIAIGVFYILSNIFYNNEAMEAYVYYDNKLIKTIDLSIEETREYTVTGYNGDVVIETKQNQIRVKSEHSPLHICSKQGWVSSSMNTIVCLPNKIVIKIGSARNDVDAVVR